MSTDLKPSGFSLKIKNFEKYPDPVKLKDNLIKDLKDRFTKVFSPPGLPPGSFSIFKEVLKDEIKNQGEGKHLGQYYKASVSLSQKAYINYEAILQELNITIDPAILAKHTKTSASLACRVTSL
jgi:hypothetical protein